MSRSLSNTLRLRVLRSTAVSVGDVLRLIRVQAQIVDRVVRRVAIDVMDDFGRIQVSTDRLFHHPAVFKDVFQAGALMCVSWVRMIVRGYNQYVTIAPNLAATFPAWREVFALAIHRVGVARQAAPVHRVAIAADVSMVRGVGARQVSSGAGATLGAKTLHPARITLGWLPALFANTVNHLVSYRSECLPNFTCGRRI